MSDNNMQQTTFWEFLQGHQIVIPIIQRDYAQGRIGKEKLREKFLFDLKTALDGNLPKGEQVLKLDFVYGSVENDQLNPLDGQQRLTTLWLLHWYIAYKAGKLSEIKNVFRKFSYETRTSSREFCSKLSGFDLKSEEPIVKLIQNQTWFYSAWKQDPTIQAMLNMLGGTPIKDKKEKEIFDGIGEIFIDCDFSVYWEKLSSKNCPIIFYYLDLFQLKLSDDLYIKMNARGKALTSFENFKADLVGFIKDNKLNEGIPPQNTIAHKLDTTWTDIFWKYNSAEHKIDDIYFAFLNRYFLNCLIISKKNDSSDYLYTQSEIESNNTFKYLYGDDSNIKYVGFEVYKIGGKDFKYETLFNNLSKTVDNFHSAFNLFSKEVINKLFLVSWDDKSVFEFIPKYINNPKATDNNNEPKSISTTLNQIHRVVFHAVCCYFENYLYDETKFRQWMRVIWNIVENANIGTIQSMIGAMRLVDELSKYSDNIYKHLKDRDVSKDFAGEQMEEEKEKARQIIDDKTNIWESKIIEAEKTAFFNGAIRFLFRKGYEDYDWSVFDERFKKVKQYFNKDGVAYLKEDATLLKSLISFFTTWDQFWGIVYDSKPSTWKTILTDRKWILPINNLLDKELPSLGNCLKSLNVNFNDVQNRVHEDLFCSDLLSNIEEECRLNWRYETYALYPPYANASWKKYVIGDNRNKIFSELIAKDNITTEQKIKQIPFYWGWELYFTTKNNNKKYQWWYALKEQNQKGEWVIVPDVNLDNLKTYLIQTSLL